MDLICCLIFNDILSLMFKAALPFEILFRMGNSTSSSASAPAPVNQIQVSVGEVGKNFPLWKKNWVLHI